MPEDHKDRAPWLKLQRNRRLSIGNLVACRLDPAGLRMPQLCRLPSYAKDRVHRSLGVAAIIDKVKVAIGQLAMGKLQLRIGLRPRRAARKVEIRASASAPRRHP